MGLLLWRLLAAELLRWGGLRCCQEAALELLLPLPPLRRSGMHSCQEAALQLLPRICYSVAGGLLGSRSCS